MLIRANYLKLNSVNLLLAKAGRNFLGPVSHLHGEKTPSFNVVEDKRFYHCFGWIKLWRCFLSLLKTTVGRLYGPVRIAQQTRRLALRFSTRQAGPTSTSVQSKPLYEIHHSKFIRHFDDAKMGKSAKPAWTCLTDWGDPTFSARLAEEEIISIENLWKRLYEKVVPIPRSLFYNLRCWNSFWCCFQDRIMFPPDSGPLLCGRLEDGDHQAKYK